MHWYNRSVIVLYYELDLCYVLKLISSQRRCLLEDWMMKVLSDIELSRSASIGIFLELEAAARSCRCLLAAWWILVLFPCTFTKHLKVVLSTQYAMIYQAKLSWISLNLFSLLWTFQHSMNWIRTLQMCIHPSV